MNTHLTPSRFFVRLVGACGINLLLASGFSAAIAAPNPDSCALIKPSDIASVLGGTPVAHAMGKNCNWSASGSNKKLTLLRLDPGSPKMTPEMGFAGMRENLQRRSQVTDEPGLGDNAFSSVDMKSGMAVLVIIKHGQLIQLQYWSTAEPLGAADLDALRIVAKKIIAAL